MSRARLILDLLRRSRAYSYGPHRSQRADLYLPAGAGPHPVVVAVHGGSWQAVFGKIVMRAVAVDLARRGWAVWNIEYRRIGRGQGGGWPATFEDVAAAIDRLPRLAEPLDLAAAVVLGHSAGGQLALWAASRERLPAGAPGAEPQVRFEAAISLAGANDLAGSWHAAPGGSVNRLMGGGPDAVPEHYALGDPMRLVPPAMPVLLVHGTDDRTVSVRRSRDYAEAARAAGGSVELIELAGPAGAHHVFIDPRSRAWGVVVDWLERRRGA